MSLFVLTNSNDSTWVNSASARITCKELRAAIKKDHLGLSHIE